MSSHSPWDLPEEPPVPDAPTPDLEPEDDKPLLLTEECHKWARRADLMWNLALADGNPSAQASALTAAFKSLQTRAALEEANRQEAETADADADAPYGRGEGGQPFGITMELADRLVRHHNAEVQKHDLVKCPACNDYENALYTGNDGYLRKEQASQVKKLLKGVVIENAVNAPN